MWLGDLLFGRPDERAYRVDVDVVRDVVAILEEEYPGIVVAVQVVEPHGVIRSVRLAELEDLTAPDLQRLHIEADVPGWTSVDPGDISMRWQISLRRDVPYFYVPTVTEANADYLANHESVARRIRQRFKDASLPMLRRRLVRWRAVAVLVPLVVMVAAWVWFEVTTDLSAPLHVLGWAAIAFATMLTVPLYRNELRRIPMPRDPKNGHLVLGQTNRQTKADRAGSRRDLKVAALSVLGTIVAAAVVYFVLGIGD